jgi:hypothetical protein
MSGPYRATSKKTNTSFLPIFSSHGAFSIHSFPIIHKLIPLPTSYLLLLASRPELFLPFIERFFAAHLPFIERFVIALRHLPILPLDHHFTFKNKQNENDYQPMHATRIYAFPPWRKKQQQTIQKLQMQLK